MMNKNSFIFVLAFVLVGMAACNNTSKSNSENTAVQSNRAAADVYTTYCVQCHGTDGKKGVLGAKDLTISVLSNQEKIEVITQGRRSMPSYKESMSAQEIKDVAAYIENLK